MSNHISDDDLQEAEKIIQSRMGINVAGNLTSRGRPAGPLATQQSGVAGTAARAAQSAAFNPGRSVYMRQGTIDARRYGRPIGTLGYPPAAWQVGPDVVDRGLYKPIEDPAMKAAGFTGQQAQSYAPVNRLASYAYDSRRPPPDVDMSSPLQIAANRAAVQARLAALTGANQVPAQVTSPASVAVHQAPLPFMGGTRGRVVDQAMRQPVPLRMANPWTAPVAPLPFMGGSRGMVANPEAGGLGVPNVVYRFPETLAERKRKARRQREWEELYGASLTRGDLSRKLAARQRRART